MLVLFISFPRKVGKGISKDMAESMILLEDANEKVVDA